MSMFSRSAEAGHRRVSALSLRIIAFNAVALVILIGGVLVVQSGSADLVDERLTGIKQQALIVAGTLAEYAADEDTRRIDVDHAEPLLRQLIAPTDLRARLYGTDGRLVVDTRNLLARNVVQTVELPPLDFWSRTRAALRRLYDGVMGVRPFARLQPYFEAGDNGRVYSEVNSALGGDAASAERVDEQNRLVLSVAVPVQRFEAIYGVLMVSTEGGDIDDILRQERETLIEVFLVALAVMIASSLYLSGVIAEPIRRLAAAADTVRRGRAGRETIPSLSERNDVKRIDRLITDISDASRLDAELSRETSEPVDLAHLLETIVEVYRIAELPNRATLALSSDLPPGAVVMARDERLAQVFRNLIDNAVSFSPEGATVTISAQAQSDVARVTVEDEGPGIPPENVETIFNRFYTERPDTHGFGKNSGLGLSIARQIVAGLGGRIRAENRGPRGARFVVELPLGGNVK